MCTSAFGLGLVATLAVNYGRHGSVLTTGYGGESWTTPPIIGLPGAMVSPGRGLLWSFPAIVLVPLGLRALWDAPHRRVALALGGLTLGQLLNVALWNMWWGGNNWGLRLYVPALPIVAVLAAIGVGSLPPRKWVRLPRYLLLVGVIWAIPCLVTDLSNGYGSTFQRESLSNFRWYAYPPFSAWLFVDHWRGEGQLDQSAVDLLWLRLARSSGNLSIAVMIIALLLALRFWVLALRCGAMSPSRRTVRHLAGRKTGLKMRAEC